MYLNTGVRVIVHNVNDGQILCSKRSNLRRELAQYPVRRFIIELALKTYQNLPRHNVVYTLSNTESLAACLHHGPT